jgi:hypothetical protein
MILGWENIKLQLEGVVIIFLAVQARSLASSSCPASRWLTRLLTALHVCSVRESRPKHDMVMCGVTTTTVNSMHRKNMIAVIPLVGKNMIAVLLIMMSLLL